MAALAMPVPSACSLDSFDAYVASRKFVLPSEGREHALALLSHSLTYPLSLGSALARAGIVKDTTRVAILGARAESSLPLRVWAELGVAVPVHWDLVLVGPAAVPKKRETLGNVSIAVRQNRVKATDDLRALFDDDITAVALFHPGLGHPNLQDGWIPGLQAVFRAQPTALLVTSFSHEDQLRDLNALTRFMDSSNAAAEGSSFLVPPSPNSFRSGRPFYEEEEQQQQPGDDSKPSLATANDRLFVVSLSNAISHTSLKIR